MKNRPSKKISIILLLTLFVVGCATTATSQTPPATMIPLVITPTRPNTESPPVPTQELEVTWTLPATLTVPDATSKVHELLQTNGDCRLPCWWGITPGLTRWEDARNILFPLAESINDGQSSDAMFVTGVVVHYFTDHGTGFEQDYTIMEGIVQETKIKLPNDLSLFYSPQEILENYGVPDEVYVGGNEYAPGADNEQYFSVVLYYTKQRIFAYYGGGFQPVQPGPSLLICFPEIEYAELHLWGSTYSFDQTRDQVFQENGNAFRPLETVTDLTINDFFKVFTNSAETPCFETPAEKWLQ